VKGYLTDGQDYTLLQHSLLEDYFLIVVSRYKKESQDHLDISHDESSNPQNLSQYQSDELSTKKTRSATKKLHSNVSQVAHLIALFGGDSIEMLTTPLSCFVICPWKDEKFTDIDAENKIKWLLGRRFLDIHIANPKTFLTVEFANGNIKEWSTFRRMLHKDLSSKGLTSIFDIHHNSRTGNVLITDDASWEMVRSAPHVALYLTQTETPSVDELPRKYHDFRETGKEARDVDLSNCSLTDFIITAPESEWFAHSLVKLNLSGNLLTKLHACLFEPVSLEVLDVSNNRISDIDVHISDKAVTSCRSVVVNLQNNLLERFRCGSEWLKLIRSLDVRGNYILDFPNDIILWMLDGGILVADVQQIDGRTSPEFVRDLGFSPNVSCYQCAGKHPLHISEVRTMSVPVKEIYTSQTGPSSFQYDGTDKDHTSSQRVQLRMSSNICKKCWKRADQQPTLKFCWICLQKLKSPGSHVCPVKKSPQQQSQSLSSHSLSITTSSTTTSSSLSRSYYTAHSQEHSLTESDYADDSFDPKAPFTCDLCKVVCTSQETLDYHLQGKRHLHKIELQLNTTYCPLCDIRATNAHGFAMHVRGSKHTKRFNALRPCIELATGKYGELIPSTNKQGQTFYIYKDPQQGEFVLTVDPKKTTVVLSDRPLFGEERFSILRKKRGIILGMEEDGRAIM